MRLLILSPTGISPAYGGVLSALDVVYTLTPKYSRGSSDESQESTESTVYIETEKITAIYPGHRKVFVSQRREISGRF